MVVPAQRDTGQAGAESGTAQGTSTEAAQQGTPAPEANGTATAASQPQPSADVTTTPEDALRTLMAVEDPDEFIRQLPQQVLDRLVKASPDLLLEKLPRLQGKVGTLAAQQADRAIREAQTRAEQEQRQREARAQEEEQRRQLLQLADSNDDRLFDVVKQQALEAEARAQRQAELQAAEERMVGTVDMQLRATYQDPDVIAAWQERPDLQRQLDYRNYATINEFTVGLAKAMAEWRVGKLTEKEVDKLAKARLAAMQSDGRVERYGREAENISGDLNLNGQPGASRVWTRAAIKALDAAGYKQHKAEIEAQYAKDGDIPE